jgi:hypothetical protein
MVLRLHEIVARFGAQPSRADESRDRICSIAHLSFFKMWGVVPVVRVVPALEARLALFHECLARFHEVALRAVISKAHSEALKIVGDLGAHRPHHDQGIHAARRRERKQMRRHLASGRHQLICLYNSVDPAQLVKPFGSEPKGECQLRRGSVREAAPVSVIVATE